MGGGKRSTQVAQETTSTTTRMDGRTDEMLGLGVAVVVTLFSRRGALPTYMTRALPPALPPNPKPVPERPPAVGLHCTPLFNCREDEDSASHT